MLLRWLGLGFLPMERIGVLNTLVVALICPVASKCHGFGHHLTPIPTPTPSVLHLIFDVAV